ncbi:hypothetical protein CPB85DRAFT_674173 [Mucidula mucida]|nr:hypothetical protein CPB85DRAFT_674173 [Mucidula mucida]
MRPAMQTGSDVVERQLELALQLVMELQNTLCTAVQQSSNPTRNQLLQVTQDAYSHSVELHSALVALQEIPAMNRSPFRQSTFHQAALPEDHSAVQPAEDEFDVGNTAFYYDPVSGAAGPDGLQLESTLARTPEDVPTGTGLITAIPQGPTVAKTPALARGDRRQESDDDSGPEDHSTFDIAALTSTETNTIHKFLTSCFDNTRIPSDLSLTRPKTRPVRDVEMAIKEADRVTELVYAPSLGDVFHRFLGGDNLHQRLTDELREILTSGPRLANSCRHFHNEGDVEYSFRAAHLTIVAEVINHIDGLTGDDRLYPHRGVINSKNGNIPGYHAFADLELKGCPCEMKKPSSIGPLYTSLLLDISSKNLGELERKMKNEKVFGATYNFSWPVEKDTKLDKETQPLIQIYTQLIEKGSNFGIASSHDFLYFVLRDGRHPRRLYISRLYRTYPSIEPAPNTPMNNALYTLYKFLRVACGTDALRKRFFEFFRREAKNIDPAATVDPVFRQDGCIDVGPESITAQENREMKKKLRARTLEETVHYKDHTTSTVTDKSSVDHTAPPEIGVEFALPARERRASGHYADLDTSAGSNESLLPAHVPKATSNRPNEQRKATAEPVVAAQAAPPRGTRNAPVAAPTVPPAKPSRSVPTTRATAAPRFDPPAVAGTSKQKKTNTKGGRQ